jgi:hypothetical protein
MNDFVLTRAQPGQGTRNHENIQLVDFLEFDKMVQLLLAPASAFNFETREGPMECPKCKGLMMLERFSDFFLIFYAWKCINCGAIIDRTISTNRRRSLAAREAQPIPTR